MSCIDDLINSRIALEELHKIGLSIIMQMLINLIYEEYSSALFS